MNLFDALPAITRIGSAIGNQPVQITFTPALPPQVRAQIATQGQNQPFTLTVSGSNGNQLTFTAPTGATYTATVSPPLPVGTQLQLSVADVLPTLPQAAQPAGQQPQVPLPPIQAKIIASPATTPTTGNTNSGNSTPVATPLPNTPILPQPGKLPSAPQPQVPTTPTLQVPAQTTTTASLKNLVTTTILQQVASVIKAVQPNSTPTTQTAQPLPVPAGPVAVTLPANLPQTLIGQPVTLTPTAPMQSNGTQTATILPATPQTGQPMSKPVQITLNLGVALPVKSPQPAILVPAAPQPTAAEETPQQPTLILTGTSTAQPATPQPNLRIILPQQPQQAEPEAHPTPQQTTQPATPTVPTAARILPPFPGQPKDVQNALLANGTTIQLKSPQPLPIGSIIVADFPINPTTGIQRVLTPDSQTQPQPNTAQQSQSAAPVAPQTQQAVLAPGMVVQGTITGQNEQGQPLITITQPPHMAGQTAALNLTENATLLPVGAQLSIKVEANLNATLLTLSLPPQTQAAYTVGTIGARWEGLQQALQLLQQSAPAQAANLRASLPQLANLLPGLIAFTNALRKNDPDEIFDSEATRLLKSMGIDLSSDVSQLSQLQQKHAQGSDPQWRGTLFPYVEATGEDPRQGGFFWRREKSDNARSSTATRFVVEVEMSQMGAMQLDGLITYPEVWLKLRRTSAPEDGFTDGLQTMVKALLETAGLTGGIAVETTSSFPVNPRAELLAQTDNPLPTTA